MSLPLVFDCIIRYYLGHGIFHRVAHLFFSKLVFLCHPMDWW